MSMGGAFTALGGDLSTLNQNPGGIGLYRNSEIGHARHQHTVGQVDHTGLQRQFQHDKSKLQQLRIYRRSVHLSSDIMPYFNWGASYSRTASFDRRFKGSIGNLQGSLTNLIA